MGVRGGNLVPWSSSTRPHLLKQKNVQGITSKRKFAGHLAQGILDPGNFVTVVSNFVTSLLRYFVVNSFSY